jgi:hypothetical protein
MWRMRIRLEALGCTNHEKGSGMPPRKPRKEELSKAGKDLRNPRNPEKRESDAAKTLRKGRKKGG